MSITGNRVELIRRVDLGPLTVELYQDPNSDMVYHGEGKGCPIGHKWTLVVRGDDFGSLTHELWPSDLYALRDLLTEVVAAATAEAESLEEE